MCRVLQCMHTLRAIMSVIIRITEREREILDRRWICHVSTGKKLDYLPLGLDPVYLVTR
jgi:hypothetical protein